MGHIFRFQPPAAKRATPDEGKLTVAPLPNGPLKIARVVTDRDTTTAHAESILLDVFGKAWPKGVKVPFTITPGGFVDTKPKCANWPGSRGWSSTRKDFTVLQAHAEPFANAVVTSKVLKAALGKTNFITLGIDLSFADGIHAELVAVYDVQKGHLIHWTGKSYPTSSQQRRLVHVMDFKSHALPNLGGEPVLILGCHDLSAYSPRGNKAASKAPNGNPNTRARAIKKVVQALRPTVVLHHPHRTDTPNIWRQAWASLTKAPTKITTWASGICYCRRDDNGKLVPQRGALDDVLTSTRNQATLDFLVDVTAYGG